MEDKSELFRQFQTLDLLYPAEYSLKIVDGKICCFKFDSAGNQVCIFEKGDEILTSVLNNPVLNERFVSILEGSSFHSLLKGTVEAERALSIIRYQEGAIRENHPQIMLSKSARKTIVDECRRNSRKWLPSGSNECAGSLVGRLDGDEVLITHAIDCGPNMDCSYTHVRTDSDHQSKRLQEILTRDKSLFYLGDWHLHPMYLPRLSAIDIQSAREILERGEAGLRADFVTVVLATFDASGELEINGFIGRIEEGDFRVEEVPVSRLENEKWISKLGCKESSQS